MQGELASVRAKMQSVSVSLKIGVLFLEYGGGVHCFVKLGIGGLKYHVGTRHHKDLLSYMFCAVLTLSTVSVPMKTATRKTSVLVKDLAHSQRNQTPRRWKQKATGALFSHAMLSCV